MSRMCGPACRSCGIGGAALGLGGVALEDALEGLIGRLTQGEHALGSVLDVLFRVAAR